MFLILEVSFAEDLLVRSKAFEGIKRRKRFL